MKNICIVLTLSLLFLGAEWVFAGDCDTGNIDIPNVCLDGTVCSATELQTHGMNSGVTRTKLVGASKVTTTVANEAKKQNITINNYCTAASCSSIETKNLTIAQVLALPKFWIKKSPTNTMYLNGQNYLDTIVPGGYKVNIPRVCTTTTNCTITSKKNYVYSNTSPIAILSGGNPTSVTLNMSVTPTITAFNLSNNAVVAGEITTVTFEFEDNIPSACANPEYEYTIDLVDVSGVSIGNGYPVFEKRALNDPSKPGIPDRIAFTKVDSLITWSVTEPFRIPADGNYRVKVGIKNLLDNFGRDLPPGSQNFISVIAGAPIVEKASIETLQTYGYNCDRTRADPNSGTYDPSYRCYYPGDTLQYKIFLKDIYGNPIVGKPVTVTYPTAPSSVALPPALTTDSNGGFLLTLTPLTVGGFVEKFTLTLPTWNGLGQTTGGQTTFEVSTGKAIPIINIDAANDFALACTNYPIRLSPICTYDDLSGCDPSGNQISGYLSNGSIGSLSIVDYAGNIKQYAYSYNHLDQIAPVIGTVSLNNKTSDISAYASTSIPLSFSATDISPAGCTNKQLRYSVDIVKDGVAMPSTPEKNMTPGTKDDTISLSKIGNYILTLKVRDSAGNVASRTLSTVKISPSNLESGIKLTVTPADAPNSKYPSASGGYNYTAAVLDEFDNIIANWQITSLEQSGQIINIDAMNSSSESALSLSNIPSQTNGLGGLQFTLWSLAPGSFTECFTLKIPDWDTEQTPKSNSLQIPSCPTTQLTQTFKYPFWWVVQAKDLSFSQPSEITIGVMTGVGVGYTFNSPSLQTSMLDKLEVDTRQGATINDRSSSGPNPIVLNVSIETDQDNMLTTVPNIQFNDHPIVSYPLGGKTVQYQFGSSDSVIDSFDPNWKVKLSDWNTPIPDNNLKPLLNIGFVGGVQTKWKLTLIFGDGSNDFSAIKVGTIRDNIRKEAYSLIRGRDSGTVFNRVKYQRCDGLNPDFAVTDAILSGVETLITLNCNISLSAKELNLASKKLGLIALRDTTAIDIGNIYIWANVQFISAAIFADGGIISSEFKTGEDRVENYMDSPTRTSKLKKQLVIEGSIITQNTLGGSLSGSGAKSVPVSVDSSLDGATPSRKLNVSVAYDLNTLRRFATTKYPTRNQWDIHPLVLIYNPKNLSDPPAGFFPRK